MEGVFWSSIMNKKTTIQSPQIACNQQAAAFTAMGGHPVSKGDRDILALVLFFKKAAKLAKALALERYWFEPDNVLLIGNIEKVNRNQRAKGLLSLGNHYCSPPVGKEKGNQ